MDPVTVAAFIGGASKVLGSALTAPPEMNSSRADSGATVNSWLDGSAWTVSTGSGSASGGVSGGAVGGAGGAGGGIGSMLAVAAVGFLAWKMLA